MPTMRRAHPRVEQSKVVIDFGDRRNRAPRPGHSRFLVNRQRRRQTIDRVDIRTRDLIQKLPRVGGKTVDVLSLPFGVKRVKRKRTLARTRHASDYRQRIPRNIDIDILKVVHTRTANANRIAGGRGLLLI